MAVYFYHPFNIITCFECRKIYPDKKITNTAIFQMNINFFKKTETTNCISPSSDKTSVPTKVFNEKNQLLATENNKLLPNKSQLKDLIEK